jgi:NAD+ synthase
VISGLTLALAQINPMVGDVGGNAAKVRDAWSNTAADLIVFPECVLSGYPADDLILNESFLVLNRRHFEQLVAESHAFKAGAVITLPWKEDGKIYNAAFVVERGQVLGRVFKHNLPNYGTFDDKRVFASGPLPEAIPFRGRQLGVLVCEDTWFPEPAAQAKKSGAEILISCNASPFERVRETGLPLIYVNQVSGHDDLLYDGGSFILDARAQIVQQFPFFEERVTSVHNGAVDTEQKEIATFYRALVFGVREYIQKNHFNAILLGMSGGIDSALSAVIAADAIGAKNLHCVMMPSRFTSVESLEDAEACARLIGTPYESVSIEEPLAAFENILNLPGLAHENIQSRLRGNILMAKSNQSGAMVLTTGNKSEVAVGYATLYGDMCGGYNALKDVYKTEVYALARWRNTQGHVIPERIITRAPSAELRANQTDQDSLPPYDLLDKILYGLIEEDHGIDDLTAAGYDRAVVLRVLNLLDAAEYKRRQAPPGPKVSRKAFGRDRRYPIVNGYRRNIEKA